MKRITSWNEIDWKRCSIELKILQNKLAIASSNGIYDRTCKQLQAQIVKSFAGRALAVRSVVSKGGKKTPGVDGVIWDSAYKKGKAIEQLLNTANYKAQPLKRVEIPKKGTNEIRPLGIPIMFDRAMQKLWHYALDPIVESNSDQRSYGFRKGRSVKDAAVYIRLNCGQLNGKRVIGNLDIRKFFDTLDHRWILQNVSMNKKVLEQFLKAGVLKNDNQYVESMMGVPQGGVISPTISNAALNGLEKLVEDIYKCQIVRYADDFLILADCEKVIFEEVLPKVNSFLYERGLDLNGSKSCIIRIEDGFKYLGYHFKEYPDATRVKGTKRGIFVVEPTDENVSRVLKSCRDIIKIHQNASSGFLIMRLNPILRGWAEHYKSFVSSRKFRKVSKAVYVALMQWIKKKHRNVPIKPLIKRYFKTVKVDKKINNWVFYGKDQRGNEITLFQIASVKIVRHSMIPISKPINPYLLRDEKAFLARNNKELKNTALFDYRKKRLITKQQGLCWHCEVAFKTTDKIELHHVIPVKNGGSNMLKNLRAVHKECHNQITYGNKKVK
jgi:RNA-directed DNA polymerase